MRRGQACDLAEAATLLWVGSDLVGAVGANQHDVFVHEVAGEKIEQVPRQRVGPVQILERDDDRSVSTEAGDELEQRREQRASRRPLGRRARRDPVAQRRQGGLRKRCGICSPNVAEQLGQRCQRDQLAAHRHASTDDQLCIGAPCSFGDECRLADACFTADEQHRRRALAGGRDRALESGQFVVAADEVCG